MESDLAQTKGRLKEALERVELVHQAVSVDLPHVVEVSFLHFLRFVLDSLVFHWLFQYACFLLYRSWRRRRSASPVSFGRSTVGWSRKPRCRGGSMSLSASWNSPVASPKTGWPR